MMHRNTHSVSPQAVQRNQRSAYQPPRLSLLGDVCSLTETGSMVAMEDFAQNGMCVFPNTTGNMC